MSTETIHEVQQQECLSSIAKKYGFVSWRTIYDHPRNADFRRKRPNPNHLYPGDEIFIPDRELKRLDRATEQRHRFVLKTRTTLLRIVVEDENGRALEHKKYKLIVNDKTYKGETESCGLIE